MISHLQLSIQNSEQSEIGKINLLEAQKNHTLHTLKVIRMLFQFIFYIYKHRQTVRMHIRVIAENMATTGLTLYTKYCIRNKVADSEAHAREQDSRKFIDQGENARLTRTETMICNLLKLDLTEKVIAEIMVIDETTVNKHKQNIFKKCGVHSTEELIDLLNVINKNYEDDLL